MSDGATYDDIKFMEVKVRKASTSPPAFYNIHSPSSRRAHACFLSLSLSLSLSLCYEIGTDYPHALCFFAGMQTHSYAQKFIRAELPGFTTKLLGLYVKHN